MKHEFIFHLTTAHRADDASIGRKLQAGETSQIDAIVGAPVTGKGLDFGPCPKKSFQNVKKVIDINSFKEF